MAAGDTFLDFGRETFSPETPGGIDHLIGRVHLDTR
jgi:hypothetical protein